MVPQDAFTDFADRYRPEIDAALAQIIDTLPSGCPAKLKEAMRYSLLANGKRIRPLLTLMAADACGAEPRSAMPAACAVEMVHAYSLIHDDLPAMDDDDLRRGQPTNHVMFGEGNAILAGDALLTLAFSVLTESLSSPRIAAECVKILASAAGPFGMVGGQFDDMHAQDGAHTIAHLESIDTRKTGALIEAALLMGAVIAEASEGQMDSLKQYAHAIGLAFQIRDDLLDLVSHASDTGKKVGKDKDQGKLTYPGFLGIDVSKRRLAELTEKATQSLSLFAAADHLKDIARYIAERRQ